MIQQTQRNLSSEIAKVQDTITRWVEFWNTRDLNRLSDIFVPDGDGPLAGVAYISSEEPGVITGMQALIDHHKGFDFIAGGNQGKGSLCLTDQEIFWNRNSNCPNVTAAWHYQVSQSSEEPSQGRVRFILVPFDEQYRISQANFSKDQSIFSKSLEELTLPGKYFPESISVGNSVGFRSARDEDWSQEASYNFQFAHNNRDASVTLRKGRGDSVLLVCESAKINKRVSFKDLSMELDKIRGLDDVLGGFQL